MTVTSFPFDDSAAYEVSWQKLMRPVMPACVIRTYRSHIDLNLLQVYGDSSGMQVKVKTGAAYVEGFYMLNDAEAILAIATSDPTNPRIDRVVAKLDRAANAITLAVLTGTPSGSPVPPTVTETDTLWHMSLAQVYVPASASTITSGNVTDERVYSSDRMIVQLGSAFYKHVGLTHTATTDQVITGDGIDGLPIPNGFAGHNLVDALACVHTKGVTGTMDIQIRRRRAGTNVDMLSTKITVGDEFYARDGVVNTSNDDVQLGDLIFIDVDTVHTTAAYGLSVALSFAKA